jgi:hypothetical protein
MEQYYVNKKRTHEIQSEQARQAKKNGLEKLA